MKTLSVCLLAVLSFLHAALASAQPEATSNYALKSESRFETGCFGACLCPVLEQPMQGTFRLRLRDFDPLFTNYDVLDVRWALPQGTSVVSILGSGTYRVGGEFAVQQQMVLDLSVGGGPVQRFDSGLVPGGGTYPDLDVRLSLHQEQTCIDTVLLVVAAPTNASSVQTTGAPLVPGIRAATPNPFRGQTRMDLELPSPQPAAIEILDLHGHVVRHLMSRRSVSAGVTPVTWDGRNDDGGECSTGLYFVRAEIGGRTFSTRVVRIR